MPAPQAGASDMHVWRVMPCLGHFPLFYRVHLSVRSDTAFARDTTTGPGLRRFQGSNDLTGEWAKQRNAQKKAITEQIAPQLVSLWVRRDAGSKWRVCRVQAQRHHQINTTIEESSRQVAAVAD